jgi:hypothetical protein
MTPNTTQIREAHMRTIYLGLIFNLLLPIVLLVVGVAIKRTMVTGGGGWAVSAETLRILFWALLAVGVSELGAAVYLKKILLKPDMPELREREASAAVSFVLSRYVVLFAVALSPAIYGFVYYLMGGTFQHFVLFGLISLVIYRIVRPTQESFFALFGVTPSGVK